MLLGDFPGGIIGRADSVVPIMEQQKAECLLQASFVRGANQYLGEVPENSEIHGQSIIQVLQFNETIAPKITEFINESNIFFEDHQIVQITEAIGYFSAKSYQEHKQLPQGIDFLVFNRFQSEITKPNAIKIQGVGEVVFKEAYDIEYGEDGNDTRTYLGTKILVMINMPDFEYSLN